MVNPTEYLRRLKPRANASILGYGISHRTRRKKPFIVKFKQNKKTIYVGSFRDLNDAQVASARYLRNLRNASV